MKTKKTLTPEQAMRYALIAADIEEEKPLCLASRYAEGLYHFVLCTAYVKYEFYVDAANGEVLGVGTEPLPHAEALNLRGGRESLLSAA